LPALLATDPRLTEVETTLAAGYVMVHWRDAGSEPDGEVRFKFRDTVPFPVATPEDSTRESVCPNATCAESSKPIAKVGAKPPLVRRFVISIHK
jgi:hypothetical protein